MKKFIIFFLMTVQAFASQDVFRSLKCGMTMMMPDYYSAEFSEGRLRNTYNVKLTYHFYGYLSPTNYTVQSTKNGFEGRGIKIFDISSQKNGTISLKIQTKAESLIEMDCTP